MLELTERGLYCPLGKFYIDPWRGVRRALITHAHGDHARSGSESYLTVNAGLRLLRARLGSEVAIETKGYGESITIGDVAVSFHPAGHILGSAQVRLEHHGEVWVVSGDYKPQRIPPAIRLCRSHAMVLSRKQRRTADLPLASRTQGIR